MNPTREMEMNEIMEKVKELLPLDRLRQFIQHTATTPNVGSLITYI